MQARVNNRLPRAEDSTEALPHDVRYAVRLLIKSPGFAVVAILSLALGIGANSTIFSFVSALLFQPLPVDKPHKLAMIYTSDFSGPAFGSSSYPDYLDFRDKTTVFSGMVARSLSSATATYGDQSEQLYGEMVTGNYFTVLGVSPSPGRGFLGQEDLTPGTHPVALISHGLWQRRFGSDPNEIGRTLALNGIPFTIAGVAPAGFRGVMGLMSAEVWVPIMMQPQLSFGRSRLQERGSRWLTVIGRLKPGATVEQAQASLNVLAGQLKEAYGRAWIDVRNQGRRVTVLSESQARVPPGFSGEVIGFLGLLMAAVGLVLLIACANIANLLLARASHRQKEIAIRLSLGAGRLRLIRQLLTESVLLSFIGGSCGLALSSWTMNLFLGLRPPIPLPISIEPRLSADVLGFTIGISILTAVLFGLAPSLQASKPALVPSLKDETETSGFRLRRSSARNAFVVAQVALSLLLLIGSGLFLRSLSKASAIDPGFDPRNMLLMSFNVRFSGYSEPGGREFFGQVLERVRALPGVTSATLADATRSICSGLGGE